MRKILALCALFPSLAFAQAAVSVCDPAGSCAKIGVTNALIPSTATSFTCGLAGQGASLATCIAGVSGKSFYITDIVAGSSTGTAGTWALQSGTDANCATTTTTVFPAAPGTTSSRFASMPNTSPPAVIHFTTPIKVTASHYLCAIGVGTNTLNVNVNGYYY